ncbi:MAG: PTS sugar transporter subunit IIA [Spirochaetales bacterium]|nr:PTS sugar transporter subunit IIA [Spirochaetales bacterium]
MEIKDFLREDRCVLLKSTRKNEVLLELLEILEAQKAVENMEELRKEIFYREQLMSTGIGLSIAVPHVRFEGVAAPIVMAGVSREGISDYASLDEKPIKIVIMIIVAKDCHRDYIRLLSMIMSHLKNEEVRDALVNAASPAQIVSILEEA